MVQRRIIRERAALNRGRFASPSRCGSIRGIPLHQPPRVDAPFALPSSFERRRRHDDLRRARPRHQQLPAADGAGGHGFRVVDAFSRIVRLGEGLAATGRLSEAAMTRTIEALRICAERVAGRRVAAGRYVATEACRRADNCAEFLARVRSATGIAMEIISSDEEVRLVVNGCAPLLDRSKPRALVFDIGGGSTELAWVAVPPDPA